MKMAARVLLILPTLVGVFGGLLLQVFDFNGTGKVRALETDKTPEEMNRHSASSDSSHHFNISSKTVVPEANKRQNYMINALLKKQHTWRHLLLSSKSLDSMKISNDSMPQFHCDNESLVLRFTVAKHTHQFLFNENFSPINIQHLPAHSRHTTEKRGSWMLLKVFFKGCYLHHKVMEWMQLHSVTVQYFDRELMCNVTAAAACLELTPSRAASRTVAPVVKCEKNEMTVKLLGRTLKHVLVSDLHVDQGKDVKQWTNNLFLYVKMNIEKEQALTLIYLDLIGKLKKTFHQGPTDHLELRKHLS
ncbi:hypothetical protein AALO_G00311400 [Alosa alosa]|uniref:Uncharacterized protein n=1 Tax=Alosa alosa TaxID=278164 RepID=A0AAV6FHA9_9TELE|nr:hypothetical protein AALO_G00311400 [Alosa alosa]